MSASEYVDRSLAFAKETSAETVLGTLLRLPMESTHETRNSFFSVKNRLIFKTKLQLQTCYTSVRTNKDDALRPLNDGPTYHEEAQVLIIFPSMRKWELVFKQFPYFTSRLTFEVEMSFRKIIFVE